MIPLCIIRRTSAKEYYKKIKKKISKSIDSATENSQVVSNKETNDYLPPQISQVIKFDVDVYPASQQRQQLGLSRTSVKFSEES